MCALLDVDAFDWEQLCVVLGDLSTLVEELSYGTTSQLLSRCLTPKVSSMNCNIVQTLFLCTYCMYMYIIIVQCHVRVHITMLVSLFSVYSFHFFQTQQ